MTCHGNKVENANCPKDQYMVVKTASYRGLSSTKTCGLSDDHSCDVDVTSLVKKQCDGQHECNITVDNNLFSDDLCPGLTKYLYFEYQCSSKNSKDVCGTLQSMNKNEYAYMKIYQSSIFINIQFVTLSHSSWSDVFKLSNYLEANSFESVV